MAAIIADRKQKQKENKKKTETKRPNLDGKQHEHGAGRVLECPGFRIDDDGFWFADTVDSINCLFYKEWPPHLFQHLSGVVGVLEVQMPVVRSRRLCDLPRLIQRLQNLSGQRTLLNILQVTLKLRLTAYTDDDAIVAVENVELGVVDHPSEGCLEQSEVVLPHNRLDDRQRLEGGVLEVALPVHAAAGAFLVAETAALGDVGGLVFAAEEAAGDGVVDYDVEAVAAAGGDELGFDGAGDGVVLEI